MGGEREWREDAGRIARGRAVREGKREDRGGREGDER